MKSPEKRFLDAVAARKKEGMIVFNQLVPAFQELSHPDNWKYTELLSLPGGISGYEHCVRIPFGNLTCEVSNWYVNENPLGNVTVRLTQQGPTPGTTMLCYERGEITAFIDGDWKDAIIKAAALMPAHRKRVAQVAEEHFRKEYIENAARNFNLDSPYPPSPQSPKLKKSQSEIEQQRRLREDFYNWAVPKLTVLAIVLLLLWAAYKFVPH